ncbi:MAG: glutamate racemase [Acidimicrobiia bacterium]
MIGVFDSGVGGLSVLTEIRRLLPGPDLTYLADRANSPYGQRSLEEVCGLAEACTAHLLHLGAGLIVVACNTASAAALQYLRSIHPGVRFVGMEPAVKPAAALTRSNVVGVLATAATFQGELFASVVGRFADGVTVINQACPGWADLVETGVTSGPVAEAAVARHLDPVLAAGADTLVLGCTHYPFLRHLISERAGPHVVIVDPTRAVARQVVAVAESNAQQGAGGLRLMTTGNAADTQNRMRELTGLDRPVTAVTLVEE